MLSDGVVENTDQLIEERYVASRLSAATVQQRRYIQNLLVVATLLKRLNYPDENIARVLSELHNASCQHLSLGINFGLFRQFGVGALENVRQGYASPFA